MALARRARAGAGAGYRVGLREQPIHEIAVGDKDDADERLPQANRRVLVTVIVAVVMPAITSIVVMVLVLVVTQKGGDLHD